MNYKADLIDGLNICHCYTPVLAYKAVHDILKFIKKRTDLSLSFINDYDKNKEKEWRKMNAEFDKFLSDPYKLFMIYQLNELYPPEKRRNSQGEYIESYLEHGSSIGGCWISSTGEDLLKVLDDAWDEEKQNYDFLMGDICDMEKYRDE